MPDIAGPVCLTRVVCGKGRGSPMDMGASRPWTGTRLAHAKGRRLRLTDDFLRGCGTKECLAPAGGAWRTTALSGVMRGIVWRGAWRGRLAPNHCPPDWMGGSGRPAGIRTTALSGGLAETHKQHP
ncbi:MAG: hypothetical protein LBH75_08135 [Treponema sp.]|nr:hypothetical protein [Treponema sp.]